MNKESIHGKFDLSGTVFVVTGAGKGIGRGIATALAEAGAAVVIHYLSSQTEATALAANLNSDKDGAAVFQADLTSPVEVERLFEFAQERFGRLDGVVNNAGIYPVTALMDMTVEQWEDVIQTNLRSVFLCSQAAARRMIAQGQGGVIINIATIEATFPAWGHTHYNAAKAGVRMFTQSAARELGQYQIRVNSISPGLIDKPGLEQAWEDGVRRWKATVPLTRLGRAEDIGNACLFLASPAASWITGIDLVVDGGASTTPAF
jgi:NAD(P)-dependent dehydrogenase (short-subunit alcohol dehydrogenase family)